jgi:predicted amidophosphoribosyltransferase
MRIKNVGIEDIFSRQMVYDFKSGLLQQSIAKCVAKELVKTYGRKVKNVVFSCIPASSQEKNEVRNKAFSALVCQFSGAIDGYSHVKVLGERTSVHGTKVKKETREQRMNEQNSIEVDAPFFFGKNVCIWDDIVTTGTSFCYFTSQLEKVGAHVTNGFFLGKTSYKYRPQS